VFAPGVKIYSTLPGGSQYGFLSGTSMAAPVVTGVAALIRSYYPGLSTKQVKFAIEKSVENSYDTADITIPGTNQHTGMNQLCSSGGFVNSYAAMELAATLKPDVTDNNKKNKKDKPVLINQENIKN